MPLSTSNFERPVPRKSWRGIGLAVVIMVGTFLVAWELFLRGNGHPISYNDSAALWASQRKRIRHEGGNATLIIGASRSLFDIDLNTWAHATGGRAPILLGIVGGSPLPVLEDLAADEFFRGTVVCGVMPGIFFSGGVPLQNAREFVSFYHRWTPAQQLSLRLGMLLESRLVFLEKDSLSARALLIQFLTRNMPGVSNPLRIGIVQADRRHLLLDRLSEEPAFQKRVRTMYLGMLEHARPLQPEVLVETLVQVKNAVCRIRARGGSVLFLRFPSSGAYLEQEDHYWPRQAYWDQLLTECEAPGIYFEDFAELRGFVCPEWSHLNPGDAENFSRALMPIYQEKMAAYSIDGGKR